MKHPRLYLDEDVYTGVAVALRRRGFNVLTTFEAGMTGSSDAQQLLYTTSQDRCIFTFNRGHFAQLHGRMLAEGKHHCGIVVSRQVDIKKAVRMLCVLLSKHSPEDLYDKLLWLSLR